MNKKFLSTLTFCVISGALFALVISALRLVVVFNFSANTRSSSYYLGMLAGLSTQWLIGSGVALIYWLLNRSRLHILTFFALPILLFIYIVSFHYEAFFFRLPSSSVLDYIKELSKIKSSLTDNAPTKWVACELLLALLAIIPGFKLIDSFVEKAEKQYLNFSIPVQSLVMVGGIFVYLAPGFQSAFYWGSRETISYFQLAVRNRAFSSSYKTTLQTQELELIRKQMGLSKNSSLNYPFCEVQNSNNVITPKHRSVIFIIIEGVDLRVVDFNYKGIQLMPNLASIANKNLSFKHFFASGSQSAQAMPSIFSAQPVQSENILIKHEPMLKMNGFPAQLSQEGYTTSYFHGSNLTYENQDLFLKMIGFNEFDTFNPLDPTPVYSWGYSDGEMFSRLQKWIVNHQSKAQTPYLATFFTASTHDPYELPNDYKLCFDNDSKFSKFADSAHYFDIKLGEFYAWYLKEEAPKGTLLVITSDHIQRVPYPDAPIETSTGEFEYSFNVPLIIAGLPQDELEDYQTYVSRYGSHIDLPSTILYLLGSKPLDCNAGLNLLSSEANWNDQRAIVSIAPDDLHFIYIQKNKYRWMYDLNRYKLSLFDTELDPYFQKDIIKPNTPETIEIEEFIKSYKKLNYYLTKDDSYSPDRNEKVVTSVDSALPQILEPNYIAAWKEVNPQLENNALVKIQHHLENGFNWIYLPIKITRDKKLVLLESHTVNLPDKKTAKVGQFMLEQLKAMPQYSQLITLDQVFESYSSKANFLLEIEFDQETLPLLYLTSALAELAQKLEKRPKTEEIIINIVGSKLIRATISQECRCDTLYQVPLTIEPDSKLFAHLSRAEYSWIYLETTQANSLVIAQAHKQGLKVVLHLKNQEQLAQFRQQLPDAVIIDSSTSPMHSN